jgi:hypothetical protein
MDFMVHLMKQIPHAKLHVSLVRYTKDDFPDKSKMYKGYTGITELDMRDTRRFKTLKTWSYYIKQVQPTTAGQEVDTTGTGVICQDMNTDAYAGDKLKVLSDADGKTPADWMTYIEQEYPNWRIVVDGDSSMGSSNFQQMLHIAGYDEEASTFFQRYSPNDLGTTEQQYKVIHETSTMDNYSYLSKYASNYWYVASNYLYTTELAQQVVLTPKVGMASPSEGQILVPSNTKCSLWIPGKLLYPGGYIHYKESPATGDSGDVDAQYDHVLMFQTYLNYQTWDYTPSATGTYYPEILRLTDFLNVMYFKDP